MLSYFPKIFANKAIGFYFLLLLVVSVLFFQYALPLWLILFGVAEVLIFFLGANYCTKAWASLSSKTFAKRLFAVSFVIRATYVLFSYFLYLEMTGEPFEFYPGDVLFYNEMGKYGHSLLEKGDWQLLDGFIQYSGGMQLADSGYPFYLSFVYWLTDDSLIFTRLLHALWLSVTSVLIYKLATRNFGEGVGRMAGIFCMLMPNLIYYCGLHLKEPVMVFLAVLFIERADCLLRGEKIKILSLLFLILIGSVTFFFRTALGVLLFASLGFALIFSSSRIVGWGKKILVTILTLCVLGVAVGDQISNEISDMVQTGSSAQEANMQWRSERKGGNQFAKYAGAAVFAPLIFTLPFPTVVYTEGQENQQMINGGNFVKNIMSFFTIFALFSLLFSGEWRKHVLPLALMCSYLLVLALSNFAHSERFHLPALPFILMFAAYGVSLMQNKHKRWFIIWCSFIFVVCIAWNWFKLAGRGMI